MLQSFHCSTQLPFLGFFGWHPSFASSLQTLLLASRILIPWLFLSSAGFYDMGISHCLRREIIHIANDFPICPRSTIPQSFSDHHLLRGGRTLIKKNQASQLLQNSRSFLCCWSHHTLSLFQSVPFQIVLLYLANPCQLTWEPCNKVHWYLLPGWEFLQAIILSFPFASTYSLAPLVFLSTLIPYLGTPLEPWWDRALYLGLPRMLPSSATFVPFYLISRG